MQESLSKKKTVISEEMQRKTLAKKNNSADMKIQQVRMMKDSDGNDEYGELN